MVIEDEGSSEKQKTRKGHEIPVPKRGEFYDSLKKVVENPPKKSRRRKGGKKKK